MYAVHHFFCRLVCEGRLIRHSCLHYFYNVSEETKAWDPLFFRWFQISVFHNIHVSFWAEISESLLVVLFFSCFPVESCIFLSILTSRHHVSHILYSQGRILVLRIDPDDTVAQAAQGKDGTGREGCTRDSRSTQGHRWIKHVCLHPSHLFMLLSSANIAISWTSKTVSFFCLCQLY